VEFREISYYNVGTSQKQKEHGTNANQTCKYTINIQKKYNFAPSNYKLKMKRIFLVGYMGSGKTTYGKMLAEKYNLDFKDLDVYIEQRQFKSISQIFKDRGEEGFRKIEHNMLKEVSEFEDVVISAGGGTPCFFDNMEIMNAMGDTVYLEASTEVLFEYLRTAKNERPLLKDKSDEEMLEYIRESLAKRVPFYEKAKYRVDARDVDWSLFEKLLK